MKNEMYIRRKNKVFIKNSNYTLPRVMLATMIKNMESVGYTFSNEVIEVLKTYNESEAVSFYNNTITTLKKMVGSHRIHKPMYPNFPKQVMDMDESELYINAMMHYLGDWIGYRIMPVSEKKARPELKDKFNLKVIELGSLEDFEIIFTNLLSAKTSISDTDKEDIKWFIESYEHSIMRIVPDVIPLKENVALFAGILLKMVPKQACNIVSKYIKTATDVLRLATQLSGGDISLATNTKFRKFTRSERKFILALLEKCCNITDDVIKYKNRWIKLAEIIHPGEYKNIFPNVFKTFDIIRNNKDYQTHNGKIEVAIANKKIDKAIELLKSRPGDFARKLDHLLRISGNKESIIADFKEVANKVSSNVLLQLMAHFDNRYVEKDIRTFFPKGNVAKVQSISYNLPDIDESYCKDIVNICKTMMVEKYKTLPDLGKCYIDKSLKNYTVPFALRSASKALKTISRGSRIDLPKGKTIRFFIWWKQPADERADIDLSAIGLDSNYKHKLDLSYWNLREDDLGCHSGDITSAPRGASEFIDININKALKRDVRYIVMSVNSFTSQPYCDLPECFAGIMIRQKCKSGEIYDPRTVENKFDLTGNTRINIPMVIDLVDLKLIWTDISLNNLNIFPNNTFANRDNTCLLVKAMTNLVKPNLYDLFKLHVKARGIMVDDINVADTVFSVDKGITPYDIDRIISEFI